MAASRELLAGLLAEVTADNAQGEFYLTDVVGLAVARGCTVEGLAVEDPVEVSGINDRARTGIPGTLRTCSAAGSPA